MKVSDYIAEFIAQRGVKHVFVVTGGCIVHSIDSVAKRTDIKNIPMQHEQSGAMAAEAYARVTGGLGVSFATSGPGATNLLTGVCCAYYDSIPTLFITGQVPSGQLKGDSKSRQIGFQETDVVSIFQSVTKYSALVSEAKRIRYELEKAVYFAFSGRPGPVLLDICDDVQRAEIDPISLEGYQPQKNSDSLPLFKGEVAECMKLLSEAKRPVLIPGAGIRLAGVVEQFKEFAQFLNIPIVPTWAAVDFMPYGDPSVVGTFGVSSERAGNFAVQNSDLMIVLGSRLDTHETGPVVKTFGPHAKKVMVDLDPAELEKCERTGLHIDVPICTDLREFFKAALPIAARLEMQDLNPWRERIAQWKSKYPICQPHHEAQQEAVNPYMFMKVLGEELPDEAFVIPDCGGNLIWTMQGLRVHGNQRIFTSFNHSPMGYAVPASVGAAFATEKPVICITGDGGCQMNIQELATIAYYKLPIKIFLMNNHGHGIIRQTLDTWLQSRYNAVNEDSGLAMPDLVKIAQAYGIQTMSIQSQAEMREQIQAVLNSRGPIFCNIEMLPDQIMEPKLVFGRPIEDSAPLLSREELAENMR